MTDQNVETGEQLIRPSEYGQPETVYLIYDGECPICSYAAKATRLREAVGRLETISARENHPLVTEAKKQGYDLDKGIVLKYQGRSYYGKDAMHMIALLSSPIGWFNKMNAFLFKSKILSAIFYPIFKFIRRCLLISLGVKRIEPDSEAPIFKTIFGESWDALPVVLKKHYTNRPYSNDVVNLDGVMHVKLSKLIRAMSPLLKIFGALVPHEGENIPTTVYSVSEPDTRNYILERHFNFPGQPYIFRSSLVPVSGKRVVEVMKFGIGWSCDFVFENNKVQLIHKSFVWRVFGIFIPLPLSLLLGKGYAEEEAIDDENFRMKMEIVHPIFGRTYEYKGQFKVNG